MGVKTPPGGSWGRYLLDLLDPPHCLACEVRLEPGSSHELLLCAACLGAFTEAQPRCGGCGLVVSGAGPELGRCGPCRLATPLWDELLVLADYGGASAEVVRAFKFRGLFFLGEQLGGRLAQLAITRGIVVDAVVPVPMPPWRRLRRGLDHTQVLAREVGFALDRPVLPALSRRLQGRVVGLGARARRDGRHGFRRRRCRDIPPRVLLIDDVVTTGATLSACAALLRQGGARQVLAAAVARTPPPR